MQRWLLRGGTVGGLLDLAGFTLGAGYNRQDDFAPATRDHDIVNLGLKYGFDGASVSLRYTFNGYDDPGVDDSHLFVVSGGRLPGVTLLVDVAFDTEDLEATSGGVMSRITRSAGG